jgi:tetratricopeptide (TPR) repeat protein
MGRHDWYRRTEWTEDDRRGFFERFDRSRTANSKAQYLLIQAQSLLSTGARELALAALELTERMIAEYPEKAFLAGAHYNRARCLVALGRDGDALSSYRQSLAARRNFPGMQDMAYLDFAWLILDRARHDLYDEALQVLDEFSGRDLVLPLYAYRAAAARSLLWVAKRDLLRAATYAREALAAAAKTESPFRYHRSIGLVGQPEESLHTTLIALAAAQQAVAADDPAAGKSE